MGLTIGILKKVSNAAFVSSKRLYLTATDEVVEDGDSRAAQLLVAAGGEVSVEDAERYNIIELAENAPSPSHSNEKAEGKVKALRAEVAALKARGPRA